MHLKEQNYVVSDCIVNVTTTLHLLLHTGVYQHSTVQYLPTTPLLQKPTTTINRLYEKTFNLI